MTNISEVLARNGLTTDPHDVEEGIPGPVVGARHELRRFEDAQRGIPSDTKRVIQTVARLLAIDVDDIDPDDPHITPAEYRQLSDARAILAEVLR